MVLEYIGPNRIQAAHSDDPVIPWLYREIWESEMGKLHPLELHERAVRFVEQGTRHNETVRRLCVSIKAVNDMVRLRHETRSLAPKRQGNPGRRKLTDVKGGVERRIRHAAGSDT